MKQWVAMSVVIVTTEDANAMNPHEDNEDDEEEDLFGQDDDEDEQKEKQNAPKPPDEDEDEEEDLFGQHDDRPSTAMEKPQDTSTKEQHRHEKSLIFTENSQEAPPAQFELDTSPSNNTDSMIKPSHDIATIPRRKITESPGSTSFSSNLHGSVPRETTSNKYGLPDGVIVPDSVDPMLLEGRILESLKQLPVNLCNDALLEYDDAMKQQKHIRSHGAYLFGVLKRYLSVHERAGGSMGQSLTPQVELRLNKLVQDGFCTQDEMNEKVKSKIRMLSEKDALFAIEEFSAVDRTTIRNFGSYFMGILNRYMRGERTKERRSNSDHDYNEMHAREDRKRTRSPDRDFRSPQQPRRGFNDDKNSYRRERQRDDSYSRMPNDRLSYANQPQHRVPPPPPPPRPYGQQQQPPQQQPQMYQPLQQVQHQPASFPMQNQFQLTIQALSQGVQSGIPPQTGLPAQAGVPPQSNPFNPALPYNNQNTQVPSVFGAPPPSQWQQQQQSQPSGQPDILGIAVKAAQALAATKNILPQPQYANQNPIQPQSAVNQSIASAYSGNQVFQPGYPQNAPAMQQTFQHSPQQQPQEYNPSRRGRTTARMHELPASVQFAVQNLQAIGHISGPLDEGILGMINDLPEDLALSAISRFASLDKSTMRNTTAYLAGVLRRELEKIRRR